MRWTMERPHASSSGLVLVRSWEQDAILALEI